MTDTVQVPENGEVRLGDRGQVVPIIVVPGIMGSRLVLHQRSGTPPLIWNPRGAPLPSGDPGSFAGAHEVLRDMQRRCVPDGGFYPYEGEDHVDAISCGFLDGAFDPRRTTGTLYELIHDYHGLALALAESDWLPTGFRPKVFCCGYDWRQSNQDSAERLTMMTQIALATTQARKVIIVAHSMGGLVARSFSANRGGESLIQSMFLLGSPSLGAPEPYLTLKQGLEPRDLSDFGLRQVALSRQAFLPFSRREAREMTRRIPSIYELLPNEVYGRADPSWLRFDSSLTGYPFRGERDAHAELTDASRPRELYADPYAGITDGASIGTGEGDHDWDRRKNERNDCGELVHRALDFHETLLRGSTGAKTAYMHPRTYFVHSPSIETIVGALIEATARFEHADANWFFPMSLTAADGDLPLPGLAMEVPAGQVRRRGGDKSVPAISAAPDPSLCSRPPIAAPQIGGNVDHVSMPSSRWVISFLKRQIGLEVSRMAREAQR